jgi:hypothetical protein
VGNIDLKIISTTKNSNKFQKTKFWKEKLVEDMVTLGPMAHAMIVSFTKTKPQLMSWKAVSCDKHKN